MKKKSSTKNNAQVVHDYAERVLTEEIPACNAVKLAMKRQINDLKLSEEDENYDYYFNEDKANHCLRWISGVCRIKGHPFVLPAWLEWLVGSWAGWCRKSDDRRRFTTVLAITGKGSTKSTAMGAVALYQLVNDLSLDVDKEIVLTANTAQQARIMLEAACEFRDYSTSLSRRTRKVGGDVNPQKIILNKKYGKGRLEKLASDTSGWNKGKSGMNLTSIFSDELGEIVGGSDSLRWLNDQFKNAWEPTTWIMSNPSIDKQFSELGKYYKQAHDMLSGVRPKDNMLAYIAELDDNMPKTILELSEKKNRKYWHMANPGLIDNFPRMDYLERQISDSIGFPTNEAQTMRVNFGVFTGSESVQTLIDPPTYDTVVGELTPFEKRKHWDLAMGADLSLIGDGDLSAIAYCWRNPMNDNLELDVDIFVAEEGLMEREKKDGMPWTQWVHDKHVIAVNDSWVGYEDLASRIYGAMNLYPNITGLAYDTQRYRHLRKEMLNVGIRKNDISEYLHKQSWQDGKADGADIKNNILFMPTSIRHFIQSVKQKKITITPNPCIKAGFVGALAVKDASFNMRLEKLRSSVKIDQAVAAVQAIGLAREKKVNPHAGLYEYLVNYNS